MSDMVLPGEPPIAVRLRRSTRARRLSLRISSLDGRVTLTLPNGVPERHARDFAQEKEPWIRRHLAERGDDVEIAPGMHVPIGGTPHQIVAGTGRSVRLEEGLLHVPGAADRTSARVLGFLKARAKLELAQASAYYADKLGRKFTAITLRDTRSRWGSCTAEGRLMYSWRLVMAPADVLAYVAAHEVAHLAELNHGPAFWEHVRVIYGDYAAARRWLRQEGNALHRYRF
ncbi:MAG: M48 family metallopeptidase [Roseobacter sp.]